MLDLDKLKSDVLIIEELLAKVTRLIDNLESNDYDILNNSIKDINVAIAIKNKLIDLNVLTKDGTLWESSLTIIRKLLDCNKTYGVEARTSEQTKDEREE